MAETNETWDVEFEIFCFQQISHRDITRAACGCAEVIGPAANCAEGQRLYQEMENAEIEEHRDMDGSYMRASLEEVARVEAATDAWEKHLGVVLTEEEQAYREHDRQYARKCDATYYCGPSHDPSSTECTLKRDHEGPHEANDPFGAGARIKWTGGQVIAGDRTPYDAEWIWPEKQP